MDSINTERSYTEYEVTTPTTDFAIGFDNYSGEDKDAIHATLDGVNLDDLDYTVVRKNAQVIEVTPAIESGVLRLQRETYIDQAFHTFTAGALFSPKSMDENFEQVRHSQQEVNDSFTFLAENTSGVVSAANAATARAIAAAELAENTDVSQLQLGLEAEINRATDADEAITQDISDLSLEVDAQKYDTGITATAKFGGVARTQASKNADTVHINDFIDPENAPTDYYTPIQNALDYLDSMGGGVLDFGMDKVYPVSAQLRVYSNIQINLHGSTLRRNFLESPTGRGLMGSNSKPLVNFSLNNGIMDTNGQNYYGIVNCIGWSGGEDIHFNRVIFMNIVDAHCIDIANSKRVTIRGCGFLGFSNSGGREFSEAIQIDPNYGEDSGLNEDIIIEYCYSGKNPDNTDPRFGAFPALVGNHSVYRAETVDRGITIQHNRTYDAVYGVRVYAWEDAVIRHNTFKGVRYGVRVNAGTGTKSLGSRNVRILDNDIICGDFYTTTGIGLEPASNGVYHEEITISGNTVRNASSGFLLQDVREATISGVNRIFDCHTGIHLRGEYINGLNIDSNLIQGCTTGIYFPAAGTNVSITRNTFKDMSARAVHLTDATYAAQRNFIDICDNTIIGAISEIIAVDSGASAYIRINRNRFRAGSSETLPTALVRSTVTGEGVEVRDNIGYGTWANIPVQAINGALFEGYVSANPEGATTGAVGSIAKYIDGDSYTEYVKTSGTGNTGWVAK